MSAAKPPADAKIQVRVFQPEDLPEVRRIFSEGMGSLWRPFFLSYVREPSFLALLAAATALAAWVSSGDALLQTIKGGSMAALFMVLVIAGFTAHGVQDYIRQSLAEDMKDVQAFYVDNPEAPKSCFWVAEAVMPVGPAQDGTDPSTEQHQQQHVIVGCVALEQKSAEQGELRRMSVDMRWQRRGIAAQLCRALLAHAKAAGFKEVFLGTSSVQPAARALYEYLGWKEVSSSKMMGPVTGHNYSYILDPALQAAAASQPVAEQKKAE